jgi:hypothetical protein
MSAPFAHPKFPELELSTQPEERRVQVRVLDKLLGVLEGRRLARQIMPWSTIPDFAKTAAVIEATDAHLTGLGTDAGLESF